MATRLDNGQELTEADSVSSFAEFVYNSELIDWRYWVHQMPKLTAAQFARLACGLDPDIFENLDSRPNKNDPRRQCDHARDMQRLAETEGKHSETPSRWVAWADGHGFRVHDGYRLEVEALGNPHKPRGDTQPSEKTWRDLARSIADEFFDKDTRFGVRDTLENYSKRVMKEMQDRKIHSPRGRITNPSTIQREALQGAKWWQGKKK